MSDWTRVATMTDVPPGKVIQVEIDDEPVVLANVEGELKALSDICSHEYYLLHEGFVEKHQGEWWIECAKHGSMFSLNTGEVRNPPATQPVDVYEVRVDGDDILLRGPMGAAEVQSK